VQTGAGRPPRIVERPEETRLPGKVVENLLLVPDMVARGHAVDAAGEDLLAQIRRDAESVRGVLDVRHHEVDPPVPDHAGKLGREDLTSGAAVDVADQGDAQAGFRWHSRRRGSRG